MARHFAKLRELFGRRDGFHMQRVFLVSSVKLWITALRRNLGEINSPTLKE
jgi:hypothetical protein